MISDEKEIINALYNGEVVGIPTDTVYGLAVLDEYKDKIFTLKNRDKDKKLINFITNINDIGKVDEFTKIELENICSKYWPGNNTLIFKQKDEYTSYRIPKEENVINLIKKIKKNLLTTSANMSGDEPCLTKEEFLKRFPNIKLLEEKVISKKNSIPSNILIIEKNNIKRIR